MMVPIKLPWCRPCFPASSAKSCRVKIEKNSRIVELPEYCKKPPVDIKRFLISLSSNIYETSLLLKKNSILTTTGHV